MATERTRTSYLGKSKTILPKNPFLTLNLREAREEGAEAYAGGVDEAMEDNDNLYQEEREAEGSEEGDGEDLIENMEE